MPLVLCDKLDPAMTVFIVVPVNSDLVKEFEWTVEDKNTLVLKRVNPLEIDTRTNSK